MKTMHAALARFLIASVTVLSPVGVRAQEASPPTPTTEPASPASTSDGVEELSLEHVVERLRDAYATAPLAERVSVKVEGADARPRQAEFVVRATAREGLMTEGSRRVRLELGPLIVVLDDATLTAIHRQDRLGFVRAEFLRPPTMGDAFAIMPTVPLPYATLLASRIEDPQRDLASWPVPQIDRVQWHTMQRVLPGTLVRLTGTESGRVVEAAVDTATWSLSRYVVTVGVDRPLRIELAFSPAGPGEGPQDFIVTTEGRQRVASIADLRPTEPTIGVGARIPGVGLMNTEMRPLTLESLLERVDSSRGDSRIAPPVAVLVFFEPGADGASPEARAGVAAAEALRERLRQRVVETQLPSRGVAIAAIALLEVDRFSPATIKSWGDRWNAAFAPPESQPQRDSPPALLLSIGERRLLTRLAPGASAAAVLIDRDQRLLASIPLDGRVNDAAAIAAELATALDGVPAPR